MWNMHIIARVIIHIVLHLDKHNSKGRGPQATTGRSAVNLRGQNIDKIFRAESMSVSEVLNKVNS
jgi:hypothetical protein